MVDDMCMYLFYNIFIKISFFMKSLEVTKLRCVRHRQVDFCVVNYMYDNHSEFKRIHQSLGSPAVMGLPENHFV